MLFPTLKPLRKEYIMKIRPFSFMSLVLTLALTVFTLGAKAYADNTSTTTATNTTQQTNVAIQDNIFSPSVVTIPVGATVTWTNQGMPGHTVTADNNSFDSGPLASQTSYSRQFSAPGQYRYYCKSHGAPGGIGMSGVVNVVASNATTNGPSIPTGLIITPLSNSSLQLSWNASTHPTANPASLTYTIYRNGTTVGTVSNGATTFTDTGLNPSTSYSYTITAGDIRGLTSMQSTSMSGMTAGTNNTNQNSSNMSTNSSTASGAPTGLTVTNGSATNSLHLNWNPTANSTTGTTRYNVYRNGSLIGTSNGTSFDDLFALPNTNYSYTIAVLDPSGTVSPVSTAVTGMVNNTTTSNSGNGNTTPTATSLMPPTGLTVTTNADTHLHIAWNSVSGMGTNSIIHYNLYRNGTLIANVNDTSYDDLYPTPGTTYTYTVAAGDANGNVSAQSAGVSGGIGAGNNFTNTGNTNTTSTTGSNSNTNTTMNQEYPWGWISIPAALFTQASLAGTSTHTTPPTNLGNTSSSNNSYPQMSGNYINCNGAVDNDMAHHTTDPTDTDPAHHQGMNCGTQNWDSSTFQHTWLPNWSGNTSNPNEWVQIPLTSQVISLLNNYILNHPTGQ